MPCAKYNLQSERTFETPCKARIAWDFELRLRIKQGEVSIKLIFEKDVFWDGIYRLPTSGAFLNQKPYKQTSHE